MADIFLSYASEDRARVEPIATRLMAHGWTLWWDREIVPGSSFEEVIDTEIAAARCVVVVWSENAIRSRWVRNEALEGLERDILVPILIDTVRIPVAFRQTQAVDLTRNEDHDDASFLALTTAIGGHVGVLPESLTKRAESGRGGHTSIAVLPLTGDADAPRDRFLIEELVDGLSAGLSRIPGAFVVSPGTTLTYVGQTVDGVAVGRKLGVRYVVEGTFRRLDDRALLTVRLTDVSRGESLWRERFDLDALASLDLIEEEIVRRVLTRLEPELARVELARFARSTPADLDSWMLLQRAGALLQIKGWHPDVLEEAVGLVDQVIDREPGLALAYAMKAVLLGVGNRLAFWMQDDGQAAAMEAADRALQLDDADSRVLGYVGCALADYRDSRQALPVLDKALELDPANAQALMARSLALADAGEFDKAIADGLSSVKASPQDSRLAGWLVGLSSIMLRAGRIDDAIVHARLSCRRDPRHFGAWLLLGLAHAMAGDPDEARQALGQAIRLRPDLTRAHLRRFYGRRSFSILETARLLPETLRDA